MNEISFYQRFKKWWLADSELVYLPEMNIPKSMSRDFGSCIWRWKEKAFENYISIIFYIGIGTGIFLGGSILFLYEAYVPGISMIFIGLAFIIVPVAILSYYIHKIRKMSKRR